MLTWLINIDFAGGGVVVPPTPGFKKGSTSVRVKGRGAKVGTTTKIS